MELKIVRAPLPDRTPGELFINGKRFSYTLEDIDRKLESGGRKVPGETCIPRSPKDKPYTVVLDFSARFQVIMPHVLGVPQFDGIRIHNGSYVGHTDGCPLVGYKLIPDGIGESKKAFADLMKILLEAYYGTKEKITLEVV